MTDPAPLSLASNPVMHCLVCDLCFASWASAPAALHRARRSARRKGKGGSSGSGGPLIVLAAAKVAAWTGHYVSCVAATWQMAGRFSLVHRSLVADNFVLTLRHSSSCSGEPSRFSRQQMPRLWGISAPLGGISTHGLDSWGVEGFGYLHGTCPIDLRRICMFLGVSTVSARPPIVSAAAKMVAWTGFRASCVAAMWQMAWTLRIRFGEFSWRIWCSLWPALVPYG